MRTYRSRDLLTAYLAARRWARAHEDIRSWHQRRYGALAAAFGVQLEKPPKHEGTDAWALGRLFEATVERHGSASSPFDGYLEAPPAIHELFERYQPTFSSAVRTLERAELDLLTELVDRLWGIGDRTVTSAELLEHGFDDATRAPDPLDYW